MNKLKPEAVLAVLIIVFFLVELKGLSHYENSDENIYFYMGKLVSDGKVPYKDFFFAHPPLRIYLNAFIIKIFGFNLFLLKLIPLLSVMLSSVFIFKLMKENFGNSEALAASSVFLFSYTIMSESTYATGINLTLMFAVIGLYFIFAKKYLLGGIFHGIASIAGLYSLVYVSVIILYLLFSSRKALIRYLLGFLLIFLAINLAFLIISNGSYFTSVYKYHLLKPKLEGSTFNVLYSVVVRSPILFALAFLFLLNHTRKLNLIAGISLAYVAFLLLANRIFNFYFVLLIPLLAMLASFSLLRMADSTKIKSAILGIVYFLLFISALLTANYLYNFDFVNFETSKEIANFINANSQEADVIFGDDTSTPLIALYSEREIAYDMVDTNFMVFMSGVVSLKETINKIEQNPPKFVIIRPLYNIGSFPEFRNYMDENCRLAKHFKDKHWADFLVYDCKQS